MLFSSLMVSAVFPLEPGGKGTSACVVSSLGVSQELLVMAEVSAH